MSKQSDNEIMSALISQVMKAANGKPETEVVTLISRPMWRAFLRATGTPQNSNPTAWIEVKDTIRVFGSYTVVIPSKRMISVSFCAHAENKPTSGIARRKK